MSEDISKIQNVDITKQVSNSSEVSSNTKSRRYDRRPSRRTELHRMLIRDKEL